MRIRLKVEFIGIGPIGQKDGQVATKLAIGKQLQCAQWALCGNEWQYFYLESDPFSGRNLDSSYFCVFTIERNLNHATLCCMICPFHRNSPTLFLDLIPKSSITLVLLFCWFAKEKIQPTCLCSISCSDLV